METFDQRIVSLHVGWVTAFIQFFEKWQIAEGLFVMQEIYAFIKREEICGQHFRGFLVMGQLDLHVLI
jgi:hypothetical protein